MEGKDPPCTWIDEARWESGFAHKHKISLKWQKSAIEACEDLQFVYFGVEDACGKVLHRFDAPAESPEARGEVETKEVEITSATKPGKLVVWPVSRSRGWLRRTDYAL